MERIRTPKASDPHTSAAGYAAFKEGAAVVERPRNILRLHGKDPLGMLGAILTNDVPQEQQQGVYAALLNPKGRIQTDLRALRNGGDVFVVTEPEGAAAAREILGRYAPFSRVQIEALSDADPPWTILGLYGPYAGELLDGLELAEHETSGAEIGGAKVLVTGVRLPAPGYDLIGPAETLRTAREQLIDRGATPVDRAAYETVRIESGTPRFGADITPENFPAEAGILDRAVSFAKGCYPGQETVARMHYRGHPNRELHRFKVEGAPPPPDTPILQNEKEIGKITSVTPLQADGETLALGYLHRSADLEGGLHADGAIVIPSQN